MNEETIPVFVRRFGSWKLSVQRVAFRSSELSRLYDDGSAEWDRTLDRLGLVDGSHRYLTRARYPMVVDGTAADSLPVTTTPGGPRWRPRALPEMLFCVVDPHTTGRKARRKPRNFHPQRPCPGV